jgi:transposase-like protein
MKKQRKHYPPEEKVAILRRHLLDKEPISNLCDELRLKPTVFYRWQRRRSRPRLELPGKRYVVNPMCYTIRRELPRPCRSSSDASRMSSLSLNVFSAVDCSRACQYCRAGHRSSGKTESNSVMRAFMRRITCTLLAP